MIKNPQKNPLKCYLQTKNSKKFGVKLDCPNSPKIKTKRYKRSKRKTKSLFDKFKEFF